MEPQVSLPAKQESSQSNHKDLQSTINYTQTQLSSSTSHVSPDLHADNANIEKLETIAHTTVLDWLGSKTGKEALTLNFKNAPERLLLDDVPGMINAPFKSCKSIENKLLRASTVKSELQSYKTCPTNLCFSGTVDNSSLQQSCPIHGFYHGPDEYAESETYIPFLEYRLWLRKMIAVKCFMYIYHPNW